VDEALSGHREVSALEPIWERHRESVRRLLIGLGRDLDLADDLLQETYLRARAGIVSYRGGNAQAWLGAIARNVFFSYRRQRYVRSEIPLDGHDPGNDDGALGTGYLDLLAIRQAIRKLSPALRAALVMKHYGEFTYQEIADQLGCAVGTAKWRVSEAVAQLRLALAPKEAAVAKCTFLVGPAVLDYVYGLLSEDAASEMQSHLTRCRDCRQQVQEIGSIISRLDTLEGDHKMMHMVDLDDAGVPTLYSAWTFVNSAGCPRADVGFNAEKDYQLEHLYQEDADLSFDVEQSPECEHRFRYEAKLARPVLPGERVDLLCVFRAASRRAAKRLDGGRFRFWWGQCPGENETVYLQAIRLPDGAAVLSAHPQPNASRSDRARTLLWRCLLPPMQQFECTIEYRF